MHAVLVRCRINRLTHIDRATGEPIRRYEHEKPGDLIHVDVKKIGRIPDGGGWRYLGKQQGDKNRSATASRTGAKNKHHQPLVGTCYLHTVIDDHSRIAYVEARDDETKETAAAVLRNAVAWFAVRGVTVQRVLSDNGSCYKSHLWRDTCIELGITPKKTRPYRPRTTARSSGSAAPGRDLEEVLHSDHSGRPLTRVRREPRSTSYRVGRAAAVTGTPLRRCHRGIG